MSEGPETKRDRRARRMTTLKKRFGGKCVVCGSTKRLVFHHVDSEEKCFEISKRSADMTMGRLEAEAQKCVLMCVSCHVSLHNGLRAVPLEQPDDEDDDYEWTF